MYLRTKSLPLVSDTVIHDMSAAGFQDVNNIERLLEVFPQLREKKADLTTTLLLEPEYEVEPQIYEDGLLRMRGTLHLRPGPISFDLLYQMDPGVWRLMAIAVIAQDVKVLIIFNPVTSWVTLSA